MYKKPHNPNRRFMFIVGVLAFAVICVVCIFTLLALRLSNMMTDKPASFADVYQIELERGFAGDSISLYLNDSLLIDGVVPSDTFSLRINRFDDNNTLLLVNKQTDSLTVLDVEAKEGRLILRRQNGATSLTTVGW